MQESHNNHFQLCTILATISTPFELETRGWSQIQGEKNVFLDPTYVLKIDRLEVEIYCT